MSDLFHLGRLETYTSKSYIVSSMQLQDDPFPPYVLSHPSWTTRDYTADVA